MRVLSTFRGSTRGPLLQVLKSALACVAAWIVADVVIGGQPPVFAAIAALLVVQPSVTQSFAKGVERSVGVVLGVVIASALALFFGSSWWVIAVAVTAGLLLAWALKMTPGTANQIGISALLVIALGATTPQYALDRVVETVMGVIIGFAVNLLLVPPVAVAPAREAVVGLVIETAARLEALAAALRVVPDRHGRTELLLEARLLRPMLVRADATIAAAQDSLSLTPRGRARRDELDALQGVVDVVSPLVTQLIGMTRAYADLATPTLGGDPTASAIAEQLDRAAHDVLLSTAVATGLSPVAGPSVSVDPEEVAALTRPLTVMRPDADNWTLIGSLLVDLERIRASLVAAHSA